MTTLNTTATFDKPGLYEWIHTMNQIFYNYSIEEGNVKAEYDNKLGSMEAISTLPIFYIKKSHYKARMEEIVHHMNYFTRFYDLDREAFFAMMMAKYKIDTVLDMPQKDVLDMILNDVVTPSFIAKCKKMSCDLYTLNINTDSTGKYNNTPKITNAQAYQIVAISFCFKILTPILLHFSNVNTNFNPSVKTEYLRWFNDIFNRIIKKFEINDTPFYTSLCKFVVFRGEKMYRNNSTAFYQKKMLRGDTPELYNENLIREVVCVKTLYKLDHRKSCVSFIDGVIHRFNMNYLKENYTSKPYEIDSEETSNDSDDSLSHAEAIEMATYRRDESAAMISDINSDYIMDQMRHWYSAFKIDDAEFDFYYRTFRPNEINNWFYENYYAGKFKDPYAVINLNRKDTVYLILCLKKTLQRYGMNHLAQLITANVFEKYKENSIKNTRFLERVTSSPIYKDIISKKYSNLSELRLKENPVLKTLPSIVNSHFKLVDYDTIINGYSLEHIDQDIVADEYIRFLSII